ncbi:MAG: hypothetical protein AAB539_00220 [Patescibacteria group bacterium]
MDLPPNILRRAPDKHLHSKEHVLADDLTRMMKEPKKFAAYLGIAMLHHESDLRALARRVLEKKDLPVSRRGKYFFAAVSGLTKKAGVRLKRARRPSKKMPRANTRNRHGKKQEKSQKNAD